MSFTAYPVGKAVVDEIQIKLSDDTSGLNATYNGIAASYGVPADLAIDWVGGVKKKSKNFVLANVNPDDWTGSGAFEYPLITLFTEGGVNQNDQKFHLYSGPVHVGMNVFLSWDEARLKLDRFEPTAWCMEDAITQVFNRARNAFPVDQFWNATDNGDVAYNGNIMWQKSRVEQAAGFWRQALAFKFIFEINQRGDI